MSLALANFKIYNQPMDTKPNLWPVITILSSLLTLIIGIATGLYLPQLFPYSIKLPTTAITESTPSPTPIHRLGFVPWEAPSSWKTISYPKFGYSFKIPSNYIATDKVEDPQSPLTPKVLQSVNLNEINASQGPNDVIITVNLSSVEDNFKLLEPSFTKNKYPSIVDKIEWWSATSSRTKETIYMAGHIAGHWDLTYTIDGTNQPLLDQILSTFKFTN